MSVGIRRYHPSYIYIDSLSAVLQRAFGPALNAEAGRWQAFKEKCL